MADVFPPVLLQAVCTATAIKSSKAFLIFPKVTSSPHASRQLAAILFTDIVGYTGMMQSDEHKTVAIIKRYNQVLEQWVSHFHGRIVNFYGDGSLCIFSSATEAVQCALEIQKVFRAEPVVPLRIGLHIGEVVFEEEKALGDGVNIASRIQSLGKANTILISAEFHDKIKNNPSLSTTSLGQFNFMHVHKPMEVFALTNDGLFVPDRKHITGKLKSNNKIKRTAPIGFILILLVTGGFFSRKMFSSSRASASTEKSIAVLPFTDMSEKQDQAFFSDGLTEDIITQLAKIKAFKVTSRTSVMQYKNKSKSMKEIGQELGTVHILEGSVQRAGNQVRITAQLINAQTDEHLWAETYDRTLDSIFSIQTDISKKIAVALEATLTPMEKELIEKKYTTNTEAYQLYLQGRYFWNQRFEEPVKKSITFFKQAIALDSTYALAYAGLGDAYLMLGVYSALKPEASFPLAKSYAEKALHLDPAVVEAQATLIDINIHYTWDLEAAETSFRHAVASNPNYANAYHWHAEVYDLRHEFELAHAESKKALEKDPYNLIINAQLAMNYNYAGRYPEAIVHSKKTLLFDSTFAVSHYHLGIAYIGLRKFDTAYTHFQLATKLSSGNTRFKAAIGFAAGMGGKKVEAKAVQEELLRQSQNKYVPAYDLAVVSLGLGDTQQALQHLEQAYLNREPWMPFIHMNPLFASLHGNAQFERIVKQIKN